MPAVTQQVSVPQEVTVLVAKDGAGSEVKIGDTVTLTLKVTGIRPSLDPETGQPGKDDLELAYVKPNGYHLHMMTVDAGMVKKA